MALNEKIQFNQFAALEAIVSEQNGDASKKIAALFPVFKELEEYVVQAQAKLGQKAGPQPEPININEPDGDSYENAIVKLALLLQLLEGKIAKDDYEKQNLDNQIAKSETTALQNAYKDLLKKLAHIRHEEKKHRIINEVTKGLEWAIAIVVSAVACCFGQFEVALVVMPLTALTATPALDKLSGVIAEGLQAAGWHDKEATEIFAKAFVLVVVLAITVLALDPFNLFNVAGTATTDGIEMTEMGMDAADEAEEVSELAEEVETEQPSEWSKLKDFYNQVNKYNPFSKLTMKQNLFVSVGLQAMMSENLIPAILQAIPMSDAKREKVEMAFTILLIVLTLMAALGGDAQDEVSNNNNLFKRLPKAAQPYLLKLQEFAKDVPRFTEATKVVEKLLYNVKGAFMITSGGLTIHQGIMENEASHSRAWIEVLQAMLDLTNDGREQSTQANSQILEENLLNNQDMQQFFSGESAVAQVLARHSPV